MNLEKCYAETTGKGTHHTAPTAVVFDDFQGHRSVENVNQIVPGMGLPMAFSASARSSSTSR